MHIQSICISEFGNFCKTSLFISTYSFKNVFALGPVPNELKDRAGPVDSRTYQT